MEEPEHDKDYVCRDLGMHDGNHVATSEVKIHMPTGVITATMDIGPVKIPQGEEVVLILRGVVGPVGYPLVPKTAGLVKRTHTINVTELLVRGAYYAADELDAHRDAISITQPSGDQGVFDYPDDDDLYGMVEG